MRRGSRESDRAGGAWQAIWVVLVVASLLALSACAPTPQVTPTLPATPTEGSSSQGATPTQAPIAPATPTTAEATQAPAAATATTAPTEQATTAVPSTGSGQVNNLGQGLVFGAQVSQSEIQGLCSQAQQLGVKATVMWVQWQMVEPRQGAYQWGAIDQAVQSLNNCGITTLGVHFQSISRWATQATAQPGTVQAQGRARQGQQGQQGQQGGREAPPKNMQDYYNVLFQMASHFKGKISRYAVENEASATWSSDPKTYFDMLDTAAKAIHAADPNAIVEDSGTGSRGFGFLLANALMKQGQTQQAAQFAGQYYAHFSEGQLGADVGTTSGLQQALSNAMVQRVIAWMPQLFSDPSYDKIQIHFYNGWQNLLSVINWVRTQQQQAGNVKPFEVWELGYGWKDTSTYNATVHAQDTVKLLAIAAGEGSVFTIYWPLPGNRVDRGTPGLVNESGQLTPAGIAYKTTVGFLEGSTSSQHVDLGNSAVWAYKFTRNGQDTYVVWGTSNATVNLPINASKVTITDINGKATSGDPKSIAVTGSPVFVQAAQ